MVFWALAEHEKVVQRHRDTGWAEGWAEGFAEGFAKGLAEARAEGWAKGRAEVVKKYESRLAVARERAKAEGIDFDKYYRP